ncbi:DUF21-domain-containing protein [Auricularia subglabra TFB-10046 SS5]|nr:DUF21-domain-containing protein [Auricularia subglabra TFB-10046 SS5]
MLVRTTLSYLYYAYYNHAVSADPSAHVLAKRAEEHDAKFIVFAVLIPVLVILSGVFAGLTLGYMSLDETQLNVLSISGTPKQQQYAAKIKPIRSNGHLLLVTLLLANMIVNETLPVISDHVLGGGIQAVVASTAMIVIFSEIIPQSLCSRYGLYIGAKCAPVVRVLTWIFLPIAWPVAKLLEVILGPHHGIIYRRGELKELIALHSAVSPHGGDLKADTVTIIGHTLDLQEKVAKDAMTPIEKVFMLHIDEKLDYETLAAVCKTGHSRIPVYDEVDFGVVGGRKVKKIIGILLVKQCVLLDPADATPVRQVPLNTVPSVPYDEPLLGILDRFQEGRSHMAIVSPIPKGRAASVKAVVKQSFTRRFMTNIGLGDDSATESDTTDDEAPAQKKRGWKKSPKGSPKHEKENGTAEVKEVDLEKGEHAEGKKDKDKKDLHDPPKSTSSYWAAMGKELEQTMPADAVLGKEGANRFLMGFKPDLDPVGIITLEDVLEELIGEEIFDEFDQSAAHRLPASEYVPPEALREIELAHRVARNKAVTVAAPGAKKPAAVPLQTTGTVSQPALQGPVPKPGMLSGLPTFGFLRTKSAPATPRDQAAPLPNADGPVPILDEPAAPPATAAGGLGLLTEERESHSAPASPTLEAQSGPMQAPTVIIQSPDEIPGTAAPLPMNRVRGASAPGRSPSPGPPGLLSLIERRRRGASGMGTSGSPASSGTNVTTANVPQAKGARFKSTPLSPSVLNPTPAAAPGKEDSDGASTKAAGAADGGVKERDMAEHAKEPQAEAKDEDADAKPVQEDGALK